MSFTVLAINPGHNGSVALVKDGKLEFFIEEERLSRIKYDGNPFASIIEAAKNNKIDVCILGGTDFQHPKLNWTGEEPHLALLRKICPHVKIISSIDVLCHHFSHAVESFYNSGFDSCVSVVIDGAGSRKNFVPGLDLDKSPAEIESIYHCKNFFVIQEKYKSFGQNNGPTIEYADNNIELLIDSTSGIVKVYEGITDYLGFDFIEAGKTMGLAPYGEYDERFKNLYVNGRGNKYLMIPFYMGGTKLNTTREYKYLNIPEEDKKLWHENPSLVTKEMKNLAWAVQEQSQVLVGDLIQKAIDITGERNVTLSGGYGLNCVANYYLKKRFPDINFYVDPLSSDAGTAIGLAKWIYMMHCQENFITPYSESLTTLYLGPDRTEEIQSFVPPDDYIEKEVNYSDVAKLIADGNIVTIFQNRSEAGPRALGNRSILFDPRVPDGKDIVNNVKRREWFRPFAGSILLEDVNDWFDMAGLKESPFMMYAVNVKEDKLGQIPSITHVDNTCRVQTVTNQQNPHYYALISAFKEITGCPILFNTSFNLAGEALVETLEDAIHTLDNSELKYLYLPEAGKLIIKQ